MRWIKCPRCGTAVGYQIARPLAMPELFGAKPNFCLYCGVKLDDPVQPAGSTQLPHNPISP
jgi:hypothetical protein